MSPPVGWIEYVPNPSPTDVCVLCNEYRLTHDDAACARFTTDDELCDWCDGAGILGDVRRADFDGRSCDACGGKGYVESGRKS